MHDNRPVHVKPTPCFSSCSEFVQIFKFNPNPSFFGRGRSESMTGGKPVKRHCWVKRSCQFCRCGYLIDFIIRCKSITQFLVDSGGNERYRKNETTKEEEMISQKLWTWLDSPPHRHTTCSSAPVICLANQFYFVECIRLVFWTIARGRYIIPNPSGHRPRPSVWSQIPPKSTQIPQVPKLSHIFSADWQTMPCSVGFVGQCWKWWL